MHPPIAWGKSLVLSSIHYYMQRIIHQPSSHFPDTSLASIFRSFGPSQGRKTTAFISPQTNSRCHSWPWRLRLRLFGRLRQSSSAWSGWRLCGIGRLLSCIGRIFPRRERVRHVPCRPVGEGGLAWSLGRETLKGGGWQKVKWKGRERERER